MSFFPFLVNLFSPPTGRILSGLPPSPVSKKDKSDIFSWTLLLVLTTRIMDGSCFVLLVSLYMWGQRGQSAHSSLFFSLYHPPCPYFRASILGNLRPLSPPSLRCDKSATLFSPPGYPLPASNGMESEPFFPFFFLRICREVA